jgi:hypothetical protein
MLFPALACSYPMNNVTSPLVSRLSVAMKNTEDYEIYHKQGIFTWNRSTTPELSRCLDFAIISTETKEEGKETSLADRRRRLRRV